MAELHHQIAIKSTPEKVYAALTTQSGLRLWWTVDANVEEQVGGKADFGFGKPATVFRMKIERLTPAKEVIWRCSGDHPEWAGATLTWSISPGDGTTVLRFTHSGWRAVTEL